uniref:Uncharacterized protein n=1 Tax=Ditylenchus dipsaci TaxID=166011 RepID=A0A915CUW3_9BILA
MDLLLEDGHDPFNDTNWIEDRVAGSAHFPSQPEPCMKSPRFVTLFQRTPWASTCCCGDLKEGDALLRVNDTDLQGATMLNPIDQENINYTPKSWNTLVTILWTAFLIQMI